MVLKWPILHPDFSAFLWAWTEPYCHLFPMVVIGHICCTHILTTCHPCPTSQPDCQFQVHRLDCNPHSSVCEWHSDPLYRSKQLSYPHFASHHYSSVAWRSIMWGLEHGCQQLEEHLIFLCYDLVTHQISRPVHLFGQPLLGGHRPVCVTPDTHSWCGWPISTTLDRRQCRDWACSALFCSRSTLSIKKVWLLCK